MSPIEVQATPVPRSPGDNRRPVVHSARMRGLRKAYRGVVALESVDLDLPTGSVLGLVGPNGSGKTTLLRLLLGLARPTGGSIELLGHPMPAGAGSVLAHVGALVGRPGFRSFLTGRANLSRLAAAEPSLPTRAVSRSVRDALHRVGLAEDTGSTATPVSERPCREYTPGQRQRLALASVLLAPRQLVVLDDPTNGLDPAGARHVHQLIRELNEEGSTVLLSSHQLAEVERLCTHVAVLAAGSVVAAGELATVLAAQPTLQIRTTQPAQALAALRANRITSHPEQDGVAVDLRGTSAPEVLRTLVRARVPVTEALGRRIGLEELYVRLTEEAG